MSPAIRISENCHIGDAHPCFVIAEISANHGQSFKRAVSMIKEAKRCGADAVKFQTYTPDTLTIKSDKKYFKIRHSMWKGQTLYQLYQKAYTPWPWFKKLKKIADNEGIMFFSTAFDKTSVDFLEDIGVLLHKVASFELVDLPLIEYIGGTKKPVILSTGMSTVSEIKEAVKAAYIGGSKGISLLKCVSSYPARPDDMNLKIIPKMRKMFRVQVGLSDHTLGIATSITAVSLGAKVIEKHFTLNRSLRTPDSFFSMEPGEFKDLVDNIRIAEKALGKASFGIAKDEMKNRIFRRSIFAIKEIKKKEEFTEENIRSIRPSCGLHPKYLKTILKKKARKDIKEGTPLSWGLIG